MTKQPEWQGRNDPPHPMRCVDCGGVAVAWCNWCQECAICLECYEHNGGLCLECVIEVQKLDAVAEYETEGG